MIIAQWSVFVFVALMAICFTAIGLNHQRGKGKHLCDDCRFNNDNDCHKKERPQALICTSYREVN
jgi:hypothetical protein